MPKKGQVKDITGVVYSGNLRAVRYVGPNRHNHAIWLWECLLCGGFKEMVADNVVRGTTKSDGCLPAGSPPVSGVRTYGRAHRYLAWHFGSAKMHKCVDCGDQADDYSYDGGAPDERPSDEPKSLGFLYSPKPYREFYSTRCKRCHITKDHANKIMVRDDQGRYVRRLEAIAA